MNPIRFAEVNIVMKAPEGDPNCVDLHACKTTCNGQPVTITAWRPSPEELVKINLGEPVYLMIWSEGMPPVLVTADNPFTPAQQFDWFCEYCHKGMMDDDLGHLHADCYFCGADCAEKWQAAR